jgi:hypothetical protein
VVAFVINLALVLYLVLTKRLFGVRGGKKAYEAHLRSESILDAEMAALDAESGLAARREPAARANAAGNSARAADRPATGGPPWPDAETRTATGPPWPDAETPAGPSSAAAAPAITDTAPTEPVVAKPAPAPAETADGPPPGDASDEPAPPPLPRRRPAR